MDNTKLHDLIALAGETSSERRRELLRGVTDLFFSRDPSSSGPQDLALFDDVLGQLAGEMEVAVRAELAERMAAVAVPPVRLIRRLANDLAVEVAGPVLRSSPALSEADLLSAAQVGGQEHLQAISRRDLVPEAVTDLIVARGDDQTIGAILSNPNAEMSRQAQEVAVDRALENAGLHAAVLHRAGLPIDLLNEMYFVVEARLRNVILERNAELDPAELDEALAVGRKTLATRDGALPEDYQDAERAIRTLRARGEIAPSVLAGYLRNKEITKFLVALSESADIDFHTSRRILERRELDALSIVCKAAGFDRALFLTFAILILDREDDAMGRAKAYGELYDALPKESAERTLRFWRIRRQTGDVLAA